MAGLSIEDATGDPFEPLRDIDLATDMMRAARAALNESAPDVLLVGRAECFLTGHPKPLPEVIRRLRAYAEAGARSFFVPGLTDIERTEKHKALGKSLRVVVWHGKGS